MHFPGESTIDAALDLPDLPRFAAVSYEPETPALDDVRGAAADALTDLPLATLPDGATVAVGVGSRGIHDLVPVVETVLGDLDDRGFDPVVVPAMGSHGGATPEGQREVLEGVGITEEGLGYPIDTRMDTVVLGEGHAGAPVHFSEAAAEADAALVINRVKPHTNFTGEIESGLCKMATIGLGKQVGAQTTHEYALAEGYVPVIEAAFEVVAAETDLVGGVAIVENFYDRTAEIAGIPADDLPEAEIPLQERAREYMPTLPYDDLDVLIIDEIGKDVSGAGMDTNVIGRYEVLNADNPETPDIDRIVVCGLTEATHGNGQGIGLADLTTSAVAAELDLDQMYTNALTSSSLSKARIPVALPDEERAVGAAVATVGHRETDGLRIAWIRDTGHLSKFRVSEALAREDHSAVEVERWGELAFENGELTFD